MPVLVAKGLRQWFRSFSPQKRIGILATATVQYTSAAVLGGLIGSMTEDGPTRLGFYLRWLPTWVLTALTCGGLTTAVRSAGVPKRIVRSIVPKRRVALRLIGLSFLTASLLLPLLLIEDTAGNQLSRNHFFVVWSLLVCGIAYTYHATGFYPSLRFCSSLSAAIRVSKRNLPGLIVTAFMAAGVAIIVAIVADIANVPSLVTQQLEGVFAGFVYTIVSTMSFYAVLSH